MTLKSKGSAVSSPAIGVDAIRVALSPSNPKGSSACRLNRCILIPLLDKLSVSQLPGGVFDCQYTRAPTDDTNKDFKLVVDLFPVSPAGAKTETASSPLVKGSPFAVQCVPALGKVLLKGDPKTTKEGVQVTIQASDQHGKPLPIDLNAIEVLIGSDTTPNKPQSDPNKKAKESSAPAASTASTAPTAGKRRPKDLKVVSGPDGTVIATWTPDEEDIGLTLPFEVTVAGSPIANGEFKGMQLPPFNVLLGLCVLSSSSANREATLRT